MKCSDIGFFVNDPVLRNIDGTHMSEFTLGIIEHVRKNKQTTTRVSYFQFTVWDKAADLIVQYCKKGDRLFFEALARQERWEKDGQKHSRIVFRITDFKFIERKHRDSEETDQTQEELTTV